MDRLEVLKAEQIRVINELVNLRIEKEKIEAEMFLLSSDFITKFRIWFHNEEECHHDWVIDSPLLRGLLSDMEPRRGQTYTLEDLIGDDDFTYIGYPEQARGWCKTDEEFEANLKEILERIQGTLQEAMDTSMKSFTCDW